MLFFLHFIYDYDKSRENMTIFDFCAPNFGMIET